MFCVNCGKSLIRGYQFCIECGTPVADMQEEENETEGAADGMPDTAQAEPAEAENGSLVFCPNCGMHMQVSTAFCETCGMRLSGAQESAPSQPQSVQPAVPLWNDDPLGGGLSEMSDSDIDRINNFMNGISDFGEGEDTSGEVSLGGQEEIGGADLGYSNFQPDYASIGGSGGYMESAEVSGATPEEIDALTAQLAQYSAATGAIPAVSAPAQQSVVSMQEEIGSGEGIRMQNFSMDAAEDEELSVTDGVPVISGGSMDEDPNDTAPINPYGFLDNDFGDFSEPSADVTAPSVSAAPTVEAVPTVGDIAPVVENIAPTIEDIAPYDTNDTLLFAGSAPVVENIVPTVDYSASVTEDIPPVAESAAPDAESVVEEVPAVSEDTSVVYAEAPTVEPVISEPQAAEVSPVLTEESLPAEQPAVQPDDDFPYYGDEPYIAEGLPVIAEYSGSSDGNIEAPEPAPAVSTPVAEAPVPTAAESAPELNRPENAERKIIYCHNCGQDMYEDELFCKNCNAPTSVALAPAPKKKSKKIVPIIAAAAVVIVGAAAAVFVINGRNAGSVIDDETLSVSDPVGDPVGNNAADPAETTEDPVPTSENNAESTEENIFPPAPVNSSEDSETEKSSGQIAAATTPKPATTAKSTTATTSGVSNASSSGTAVSAAATPKPSTTSATTKPATAATTAKTTGSATISSAKVTSLENDRKAITDAVAVIAGEVGKIEALAQNVIYAMENGGGESARTAFYSRDFAKNMLSSIDSGKTAVDNAVSAAAPKNSEFDSAYNNLVTLQGKYEAYYKFIKSPTGDTGKFSSSCGTYLSGVTSYISSNFKYSSLTVSSYTSDDVSLAYKSMMSDAVAAANSAVTGFGSVESALSALDDSSFETAAVKELSKSAVTKNYANAAANTQKVAGYVLMLSGAPSEYSSAYNSLKSAGSELTSLVDLLVMIQENTLDNYIDSSQDGITAAKSAVSIVKKAVS